jgi:peptide methionine sulfoxide reductase MsrA
MALKKESLPQKLEAVHIEEMCRSFLSFNVPPGSSEHQYYDMGMAFMTGAYMFLALMQRIKKEKQERQDALFEQWSTELETWYAAMEAEHSKGKKQ